MIASNTLSPPHALPPATVNLYWLKFTGTMLMMRAVFIVLLLALLPVQARAEARIALLVGNQAYTPKVGLLKNPHEDVALIGAALKRLGFEVTILKDADYRAMDVAIKRFITDVRTKGKGAISFSVVTPPQSAASAASRCAASCWRAHIAA